MQYSAIIRTASMFKEAESLKFISGGLQSSSKRNVPAIVVVSVNV